MRSSVTATLAPPRRARTTAAPVLKAKLVRPNLGPQVLDRPRLLHVLREHAERPLTLVIADAGYGKTTLITAFTRSLPRPVVWYSLMPSDADPVVFGRYLLEGFRRIDEWRVIEREIATFDEVFVRNEIKIDELPRGTLTRWTTSRTSPATGRWSPSWTPCCACCRARRAC